MKKKIFIGFLLILIVVGVAGYLYREPFLAKAGQFMAPQSNDTADVVILEGASYIYSGFIQKGMEMLAGGKAKKMIVVIHRIAPAHHPFGVNGDYPDAVRQKMKEIGLKENQFKIVVTPLRNPVTLTEAQFVFKDLESEKISSAILVAQSFHTRRSYLAYAYVAEPLKIKIYPLAGFTDFKMERWWTTDPGWREFLSESGKLFYYLVFGHIPFKFSY